MNKFTMSLLLILFPLRIFSGWSNCEGFECLNLSDTTIKQIEVTEDEHYMYAIDSKFRMYKIDLTSGDLEWSKDLRAMFYDSMETILDIKIGRGLRYLGVLSINKTNDLNDYSRKDTYFLRLYDFENLKQLGNEIRFLNLGLIYPLLPGGWIDLKEFYVDFKIIYDFVFYFQNWNAHCIGNGYFKDITGGSLNIVKILKNMELQDFGELLLRTSSIVELENIGFYVGGIKSVFEYFLARNNNDRYFCDSYSFVYHTQDKIFDISNLIKRKTKNECSNKTIFGFKKGNQKIYLIHFDGLLLLAVDDTLNILAKVGFPAIFDLKFSNSLNVFIANVGKKILFLNSINLETVATLYQTKGNISQIWLLKDEQTLYFTENNRIYRYNLYDFKPIIKSRFTTDYDVYFENYGIQFHNESTGDPSYIYWDFGDGRGSTENEPIHSYSDTGLFNVRLIVGRGEVYDTFDKKIEIVPYLESKFTYKIINTDCYGQIMFNNESKGKIDSVLWDFGNSVLSREFSPTYYYPLQGEYNVTLKCFSRRFTSVYSEKIKININYYNTDKRVEIFEKFQIDSKGFPNYSAPNYYTYFNFHPSKLKDYFKAYRTRDGGVVFHNKNGLVKLKDGEIAWNIDFPFGNLNKFENNDLFLFHPDKDTMIYLIDGNGSIVNKTKFLSIDTAPRFLTCDFVVKDSTIFLFFPISYEYYLWGSGATFSKIQIYKSICDKNLNSIKQPILFVTLPNFSNYFLFQRAGSISIVDMTYYLELFQCPYSNQFNFAWICDIFFMFDSVVYCNMKTPEPVFDSNCKFTKAYLDWLQLPPCLYLRWAEGLNDSLIVVADKTDLLYANMNKNPEHWKKYPTDFDNIVKIVRYNDTIIIVVGSRGGHPMYALFNYLGVELESGLLSCYPGEFKDASVGDDGSVLLTAQIFKNFNTGSWEFFFFKLNSNYLTSKSSNMVENSPLILQQIKLNPNPTKNKLYIPREVNLDKLQIVILDIFGKQVSRFDNLQTYEIDVADLVKGVYLLEISYDGIKSRQMIVKF